VDRLAVIQVQRREDPAPLGDLRALEVLTKVTQALQVQGDLAEVSQEKADLELRLVDFKVLAECQRTHSSRLMEGLDLLSQTESICRLTTRNDSMPANGQTLSHYI
jgi:hypothetical protein